MGGPVISRRDGLAGLAAAALAHPAVAQERAGEPRVYEFPTRSVRNPAIVIPERQGAPMTGTTLLLLHGSGGLGNALPVFEENGRRLAAMGYRVVIPAYFSASEDPMATDERAWWSQAVEDVAAWSTTLPGADRSRLVAIGYSLGGELAAQIALRKTDIAAVVGVASAGDIDPASIARRPPVLLIHATRDPVVPAAQTRRWARLLEDNGVPVRTHSLNVDRHAFEDAEWRDIFGRADDFFRRSLTSAAAS
jgi:dienelactone hydrolase